jgi:type II secretion system protein H
MLTLVTGKNDKKINGFSLIELLTVLVIIGIIASLTRLAIPNSEKRSWENETQQLVSVLNQANEESILLGVSFEVVIDDQGWRFYQTNARQERLLMNDVFSPKRWDKPVLITGRNTFSIGDLSQNQGIEITLKRNDFSVKLLREPSGRFLLSTA